MYLPWRSAQLLRRGFGAFAALYHSDDSSAAQR
jgi:hypothetical protein